MKISKLRRTFAGCLALSMGVAFPAMGAVYQSGVTVGPGGGGPFGDYVIRTNTRPDFGGDGAYLWLSVDTHLVLRPVSYTVGIGHVWYRTLTGRAIDPAFAATATPFANPFTNDLSGQIQMTSGGSFLLGFWLDANTDRIPDAGDRFGWARLRYTTANGLTLLDNAIEDTGAGIIAGTTTPVPEPSASLLPGGLLAVLGSRRRWDRKGK